MEFTRKKIAFLQELKRLHTEKIGESDWLAATSGKRKPSERDLRGLIAQAKKILVEYFPVSQNLHEVSHPPLPEDDGYVSRDVMFETLKQKFESRGLDEPDADVGKLISYAVEDFLKHIIEEVIPLASSRQSAAVNDLDDKDDSEKGRICKISRADLLHFMENDSQFMRSDLLYTLYLKPLIFAPTARPPMQTDVHVWESSE